MNNNFKLILILFFLSKLSLKKYFKTLDLLRTNSQCDAACKECDPASSHCWECKKGYCGTFEGTCVGNEQNFLIF